MTLFRPKPKSPVHELVARQRAIVLRDWRSWVLPVVVALGPLAYVVFRIGWRGAYFNEAVASISYAPLRLVVGALPVCLALSIAAARWKSRWLLRWTRVRDMGATPMHPEDIRALMEAGFLLPWMVAFGGMVVVDWLLAGSVLVSPTELATGDRSELSWLMAMSPLYAGFYLCFARMNVALTWNEIVQTRGGFVPMLRLALLQGGSTCSVMALTEGCGLAIHFGALELFDSVLGRSQSTLLLMLPMILMVLGISIFAERRLAVRLREKLESDTGG